MRMKALEPDSIKFKFCFWLVAIVALSKLLNLPASVSSSVK